LPYRHDRRKSSNRSNDNTPNYFSHSEKATTDSKENPFRKPRPQPSRPPVNYASRNGRRNYINPGLKINPNRFINRVTETVAEVPYEPTHKFIDFAVDTRLKQNITAKGYVHPTAIQDQSIPHVLAGKDVIGLANTGTGKTAAFLIPLIDKIIKNQNEKVLIMVPTRELALQIQDELFSFTAGLRIYSAFCIGGSNIGKQIFNLRRNPHFIIGTPGRLKDLIERRALYLGDVKTVVLDEADRMLDMGFINDMQEILSLLPKERQTLLFSATLSPQIENLTRQFQQNPIKVSVKTGDTSANVDQDIVRYQSEEHKIDILHDILIQPDLNKVLIFGQTKHGVEKLSKHLNERGFKSDSIHGNKTQAARQKALRQFKQDELTILVATDVAARGLDIPLVSHVINFDVPSSYEDYVHRIGRTGRAGNAGKALTFVS
jgi:superfamily II DNA/RNA helicase